MFLNDFITGVQRRGEGEGVGEGVWEEVWGGGIGRRYEGRRYWDGHEVSTRC